MARAFPLKPPVTVLAGLIRRRDRRGPDGLQPCLSKGASCGVAADAELARDVRERGSFGYELTKALRIDHTVMVGQLSDGRLALDPAAARAVIATSTTAASVSPARVLNIGSGIPERAEP